MTLQQLMYAVEVYKAGSISRAAQNLYIAQPNLSNIIKDLEREIGITIFRRTPRGIELTKMGEAFIRQALDITSRFQSFEKIYKRNGQPEIWFSVTTARSSQISNRIAKYINSFSTQRVPFRIRFKEATNSEVIEDVAMGDADIGILRPNNMVAEYYFQMARLRGLKVLPLKSQKYVLLFSQQHPLADTPVITADMLEPYTEVVHADYDMPLYPHSDYSYTDTSSQIKDGKKQVIFVYERGTLMDILPNVVGSYIWTTTTDTRVREAYGLVERECEMPPVSGMDAIILGQDKLLSPELEKLIGTIQSEDGQD